MIVFYYVFYRISKFYVKYDIEGLPLEMSNPEIYSNGWTSLMQSFNVISILYFVFGIDLTMIISIFVFGSILIMNMILLTEKKLKELEIRWDGEDYKTKRKRGFLVVLYVLVSVLLFICMMFS